MEVVVHTSSPLDRSETGIGLRGELPFNSSLPPFNRFFFFPGTDPEYTDQSEVK